MAENTCVSCGEQIPEGQQVCYRCCRTALAPDSTEVYYIKVTTVTDADGVPSVKYERMDGKQE